MHPVFPHFSAFYRIFIMISKENKNIEIIPNATPGKNIRFVTGLHCSISALQYPGFIHARQFLKITETARQSSHNQTAVHG